MTPRAVRPARARKRATGLWEARFAGRITSGADTECIPVTTSLAGRQTSATRLATTVGLPECQQPCTLRLGRPDRYSGQKSVTPRSCIACTLSRGAPDRHDGECESE